MIRSSFRKWMLPFYSNVRFLKKENYIPMNYGVDHDLLSVDANHFIFPMNYGIDHDLFSVDPIHLIFPVNTNNLEQNGKYSNPLY